MKVHDVFHVSLPDQYVNNRATYIERRQRTTSPRLTRTPIEPVDDYHRENPLEPRAWEARVGTEDQEIAEESETAEDERLQKARDG
jgi:hypothetical protein